MPAVRLFKNRWFARFARKEGITDAQLCEAVQRAGRGLCDADLGGGVIKQRIPRPGEGRSGGWRTIIVFRAGDRAVFVYGFAKSARANIEPDEEDAFRQAAKELLAVSADMLDELVERGTLTEVRCDD